MAQYLLDTNIISYLDDDQSPYYHSVYQKLSSLTDKDSVSISILSIFEYQSSIVSIQDNEIKKALMQRKELFIEMFDILNLQLGIDEIFASLLFRYKQKTGISTKALKKHNFDFLIASTAIFYNHILVSNDKIFTDIAKIESSFMFENWV